jgi:hypothetical protein
VFQDFFEESSNQIALVTQRSNLNVGQNVQNAGMNQTHLSEPDDPNSQFPLAQTT